MRSLSRIIPILGENPEGVDLYFLNNAKPAVKTKGLKVGLRSELTRLLLISIVFRAQKK